MKRKDSKTGFFLCILATFSSALLPDNNNATSTEESALTSSFADNWDVPFHIEGAAALTSVAVSAFARYHMYWKIAKGIKENHLEPEIITGGPRPALPCLFGSGVMLSASSEQIERISHVVDLKAHFLRPALARVFDATSTLAGFYPIIPWISGAKYNPSPTLSENDHMHAMLGLSVVQALSWFLLWISFTKVKNLPYLQDHYLLNIADSPAVTMAGAFFWTALLNIGHILNWVTYNAL